MDVTGVVQHVAEELRNTATEERAVREKRYLKSDFVHIGVTVPGIRKIVKSAVRAERPDRPEMLALAERLWAERDDGTPIHEMRMAAIEVLTYRVALLNAGDVHFAERLIRDSDSWVYVDGLAEKVVGTLVVREPALSGTLDRWVGDKDFWIRRTTLLALLAGIRSGHGDLDRLSRYGDALIEEKEFFIRKALGWVLRELSKKDPDWVGDWVASRTSRISGVTIREAVRHLPEPTATKLMTVYRS